MFSMDIGPLPCHAANAEVRSSETRLIDLLVKPKFFGKLLSWGEDKRLNKISNSFWPSTKPTIRLGLAE